MDKRLTPEVIAALKGCAPVTGRGLPFTPPAYLRAEVPPEVRPVFFLRGWTHEEMMAITAAAKVATRDGADGDTFVDTMSEYGRRACNGWTTLLDLGTLEEIPFVSDPVSGAGVDAWVTIPAPIRASIYQQIRVISGLTPEQKEGLG